MVCILYIVERITLQTPTLLRDLRGMPDSNLQENYMYLAFLRIELGNGTARLAAPPYTGRELEINMETLEVTYKKTEEEKRAEKNARRRAAAKVKRNLAIGNLALDGINVPVVVVPPATSRKRKRSSSPTNLEAVASITPPANASPGTIEKFNRSELAKGKSLTIA